MSKHCIILYHRVEDLLVFTSAEVLDPAAVDLKGQLYTAHFVVGSLKKDEERRIKNTLRNTFINLPNFSDVSLSGNCWHVRFNIFSETNFGKIVTRKGKINLVSSDTFPVTWKNTVEIRVSQSDEGDMIFRLNYYD